MKKIGKLIILNLFLIFIIFILPNKQIIQNIEEIISNNDIEKNVETTARAETKSREEIENLEIDFEMNILTLSNLTTERLEKAFTGTNMQGLSNAFIIAEKENQINAIYLSGLACHESAWGSSNFAKTRNNIFGWQSYDSNLNATRYFESKENSISYVANKLKINYLSENGCYFSGYTISNVSNRYATDPLHSQKVFNTMKKIVEKINK